LLHVPPEQHGCISAPHAPHMPVLSHPRPVSHVCPAQQAWFEPPHCAQMLLTMSQTYPACVHVRSQQT
jgi:hypothetical protein